MKLSSNTDIRNILQDAMKAVKNVDYMDIRVEDTQTLNVLFKNKDVENLARRYNYGGFVRVLLKGG